VTEEDLRKGGNGMEKAVDGHEDFEIGDGER
jgi:hypothetical protein